MPKSALVPVMTITSNAMPPSGVRITDIILRPVPCRPLLTNNAQTDNLIINDVKKTARELVVNKDMSIPVLRDAFMQPPTAARGILLTVVGIPVIIMATNQTEKASLKRVAFLRSQTILLFRKKINLMVEALMRIYFEG